MAKQKSTPGAIGLRLLNFSRQRINHYISQPRFVSRAALPPSWQEAIETPLVWADDAPAPLTPPLPEMELPPAEDAEAAAPPGEQKIGADLLRILELHSARTQSAEPAPTPTPDQPQPIQRQIERPRRGRVAEVPTPRPPKRQINHFQESQPPAPLIEPATSTDFPEVLEPSRAGMKAKVLPPTPQAAPSIPRKPVPAPRPVPPAPRSLPEAVHPPLEDALPEACWDWSPPPPPVNTPRTETLPLAVQPPIPRDPVVPIRRALIQELPGSRTSPSDPGVRPMSLRPVTSDMADWPDDGVTEPIEYGDIGLADTDSPSIQRTPELPTTLPAERPRNRRRATGPLPAPVPEAALEPASIPMNLDSLPDDMEWGATLPVTTLSDIATWVPNDAEPDVQRHPAVAFDPPDPETPSVPFDVAAFTLNYAEDAEWGDIIPLSADAAAPTWESPPLIGLPSAPPAAPLQTARPSVQRQSIPSHDDFTDDPDYDTTYVLPGEQAEPEPYNYDQDASDSDFPQAELLHLLRLPPDTPVAGLRHSQRHPLDELRSSSHDNEEEEAASSAARNGRNPLDELRGHPPPADEPDSGLPRSRRNPLDVLRGRPPSDEPVDYDDNGRSQHQAVPLDQALMPQPTVTFQNAQSVEAQAGPPPSSNGSGERPPESANGQGADVDKLARDVYRLLRNRLRIEQERRSDT